MLTQQEKRMRWVGKNKHDQIVKEFDDETAAENWLDGQIGTRQGFGASIEYTDKEK